MIRALILEDDACSALAMSSLLDQQGISSITVADTADAVEEVRKSKPDVLLADWNALGEHSSLELAQELRRVRPDSKVLFISGFSLDYIEKQIGDFAPCTVFTKPINFEELVDEISSFHPGAGQSIVTEIAANY